MTADQYNTLTDQQKIFVDLLGQILKEVRVISGSLDSMNQSLDA